MTKDNLRSKGKSTDKIIRKILLDYYTSSKSWKVQQTFVEQCLTINDVSLNQQLNDGLEGNVEPGTKLNLNGIGEQVTLGYLHDMFDPENPIEGNIDIASFHQIGKQFEIGIPVKEIKEKYGISYETIKNRVVPFFNKKIINQGKAHAIYLYLKPEVYSALSYYLAVDKHFNKEGDYYRKIYNLFSE